jgi:hypothetical protein
MLGKHERSGAGPHVSIRLMSIVAAADHVVDGFAFDPADPDATAAFAVPPSLIPRTSVRWAMKSRRRLAGGPRGWRTRVGDATNQKPPRKWLFHFCWRARGALGCAPCAQQMGDSERAGRSTPSPSHLTREPRRWLTRLRDATKKKATRGWLFSFFLAETVSVESSYDEALVYVPYPPSYPPGDFADLRCPSHGRNTALQAVLLG